MMASKLYSVVTLFYVAAVLFSSCENLPNLPSPPPFSISGFEIKKGTVDKICRVASASFYFINTGSKDIDAFRMTFRLYDSDKKPIGFGDNKAIFEYSGTIASSEEREIVVSLDKFVPQDTGSNIVADQIFVESVLFSDGERWEDRFGVYQL